MMKIILILLVVVTVFAWAVYSGLLWNLTTQVININTNVLPYIPLSLRLWLSFVILGLIVAFVKSWIQ